MTESKKELRRRVREMAHPVNAERVLAKIVCHPWFQEAQRIMAYSAIPPEIDLEPVLELVLKQGKTLLLPRCEADGTMTARIVNSMDVLRPGAYGIMEPEPETRCIAPEKIDLILVPGLAFDEKGHRLGRGKGYYDRFLAQTTGKTIGVSRCLVPEVPVEPHDKRMDAVVTDKI